jgi:hypothetical protein
MVFVIKSCRTCFHPSQPRLQPADACIGSGPCSFEIFRGCRLIFSIRGDPGKQANRDDGAHLEGPKNLWGAR